MSTTNVVYLLHFDRPLSGRSHYIGVTTPGRLEGRLGEHAAGRGAKFTRAMMEQGASFQCARVWQCSTPAFERKLKRRSHYARSCPICNAIGVDGIAASTVVYRATFSPAADNAPALLCW